MKTLAALSAGCLIAYLIGSVSFAFLIGKWVKGIDIRQHGSGNLGATNVFRVIGKKWGLFVFFLDAAKGYAAVVIADFLIAEPLGAWFPIALGISSIAGHTFPFWLRFKGGKGVATSLGVFLAIAFKPTLITFGLWILIFSFSRIISLASLSAAMLFPFVIFFTALRNALFPYLMAVSFVLIIFIFYTHRANLLRLLRGEEKRLF